MKIVYLINELSIRGGTHKQLLRLCQYSEKQGADFLILTKSYLTDLGYSEFKAFNNKIKVIAPINTSKLSNIKCQLDIAKFLKNSKTDIINIHDNGFQYVIIFLKLLRSKAKIFWQINDLPICFRVGNLKDTQRKWTYSYSRFIIRFSAKLVDRITVNVSKNKARVQNNLKRDAAVLYCGIDKHLIDLKPIKKEIKFPKIKLLSIGVLFPYRNYETLIEVAKNLIMKNYQVELNIVGSTSLNPGYAQKIEALINDNNLIDNIRILGNIKEDELHNLFTTSDVFLFLNIDQSWGLAVFEAMAYSLPVIVSNSVGAIELLENRRTALINDPLDVNKIAESIEELTIDTNHLNYITTQAKLAISNMSWDEMYSSKLLELFKNEK